MTTENIVHNQPVNLLKTALLGNATFSMISGFLMVLAADPINDMMGLPETPVLFITGIILIPYAIFLYWVAMQRPIASQFAIAAILLDIAWVTGSIFLLISGLAPLSAAGKWAVAITADIVALFALLQFIGLRRVTRDGI